MDPLPRQLRWLLALRLIIVTSIVVPYFLLETFLPTTVQPTSAILVPGEEPYGEDAGGGDAAAEGEGGAATEDAAQGEGPDAGDDAAGGEGPADAAGEAGTERDGGAPAGDRPAPGTEVLGDTASDTAAEAAAEPMATSPPADAAGEPEAPAGQAAEPAADGEAEGEAASRGSPFLNRGPTTVLIAERRRSGIDAGMIYRAAGVVYLASLLYFVLLRLFPKRRKLNAYVQFGGDLLMVTALVYFTGGITSPFSLFYLVSIAIASTLLGYRGGFSVATTAYVLYAATLMGIYYGHLPLPEAHQQADDPIFRLTYNLAVHFIGFYAVAYLTSLLAQRVSRAERELEAKSESLADLQVVHRDVIQSISSGLATTDLAGRITSLNRAGLEILGRREEEMLGRSAPDLIGEERWARLTADADAGTGTETQEAAYDASSDRRSEVRLERHGEPVFVGFTLSPLTDASGTQHGWNMVFQDLTRWRRLEEQVRLKDRMAAVGELAAGIAHEIGNPLAAISGSAQMLSRSLEGDPQQAKLLRILVNESQRLDRTIKGFLRFARPRDRSTSSFDVARLLTENFELLGNSEEVGPGHRLHLDLDPPSYQVVADPDQVSQVFWNLARNALKAMPDGGDLHVGGHPVTGSTDGGGASAVYRMTFRDTGQGMSERQRANLFHPFQSFFDSGTGIGMAIVYQIVRDHGGETRVDSTPGRGTTITVELPTSAEGWPPGRSARAAAEGAS